MSPTELASFDYDANKQQIFDKIVRSIEAAIKKKADQIYIKKLKIVDEELDVVAAREEWPNCLNKAINFYKAIENYESCANCQKLLDELSKPPKKTKSNARKTT